MAAPLSPVEVERLWALRLCGAAPIDIADELGRSVTVVRYALRLSRKRVPAPTWYLWRRVRHLPSARAAAIETGLGERMMRRIMHEGQTWICIATLDRILDYTGESWRFDEFAGDAHAG